MNKLTSAAGTVLALTLVLQEITSLPLPTTSGASANATGAMAGAGVLEGLGTTLSWTVLLYLLTALAVLVLVVKQWRKSCRPKFHNRLVLHVSSTAFCASVTVWQGNKCPIFLRLNTWQTPHQLRVTGCLRPRLELEVEDHSLSDRNTHTTEALAWRLPLTLFQAWKLRGLLAADRRFCHFEWRHEGAAFPLHVGKMATRSLVQALSTSVHPEEEEEEEETEISTALVPPLVA